MLLALCARCLLIELIHNEQLFFIDMTSDTARWKQSLIPLAYSEYKIRTTFSSVKEKTEAGSRVVDVLGSAQPFFLRFSMTVTHSVLVCDMRHEILFQVRLKSPYRTVVAGLCQVSVKSKYSFGKSMLINPLSLSNLSSKAISISMVNLSLIILWYIMYKTGIYWLASLTPQVL